MELTILHKAGSCWTHGLSTFFSGYALLPPPLRTVKEILINMVLNMCLLDFVETSLDGKSSYLFLDIGRHITEHVRFSTQILEGTSSSVAPPHLLVFNYLCNSLFWSIGGACNLLRISKRWQKHWDVTLIIAVQLYHSPSQQTGKRDSSCRLEEVSDHVGEAHETKPLRTV